MKKQATRGLTLTEVVVGAAIAGIIFLGLAAFFVTFSHGRALNIKKIQMNTVMSRLKNSLYAETRGQSWFNMTKNVSAFQFSEFPGIFYDLEVGDIQAGVRSALVRVYYFPGGASGTNPREIRSEFTLVQHQGREVGGSIKIIATVEGTGTPVENLYIQAPPMEGSIPIIRRTDSNGEALLTGTRIGVTPVSMNTDTHGIPFYFPASGPHRAGLRRDQNVTAIGTGQVVLAVQLRPKNQVTVQVRKRNGGVDTTIPVPSARIAVEGRNLLFPPEQNYNMVANMDGNLVLSVIPGQWRFTVRSAVLSTTEVRGGVDAPNTNAPIAGWFDYLTLAQGDAPLTYTVYEPMLGNVSGRVRIVRYNPLNGGGKYEFLATGASSVPLSFSQTGWRTTYPDVAGAPVIDMVNSVTRIWSFGGGDAYRRDVTTNGSGDYTVNQVGPLIFHRNYGLYPPEGAQGDIAFKVGPTVPDSYLPVQVYSGVQPANRHQIKFMAITGHGWGDYQNYPRPANGDNTRMSGFKSTVRPEDHVSNQGQDFYVLDGSDANLVRIKGTVKKADGVTDFIPGAGWNCTAEAFIEVSGVLFSALGINKNGGNAMVRTSSRIGLSPTAAQMYDFVRMLPSLGGNAHTIRYTAWRLATTPKNFALSARVWVNEHDPVLGTYDRVPRDLESIGSVNARVEYKDRNGNHYVAFNKAGSVSGGAFQPPVFVESARQFEEFKSEVNQPNTEPTDATWYTLDMTLPSDTPTTTLLRHFLSDATLPVNYRKVPSAWPLELAYNGLTGTYSGRMELELLSSIRLVGRVYDIFGNPVPGATIRISRAGDTDATTSTVGAINMTGVSLDGCARLPCTSAAQYDKTVSIPHASDIWSWKVAFEHPTYLPMQSRTFLVHETISGIHQYDFPVLRRPTGDGI